MGSSKYRRLIVALIFLFSLFLFQASEEGHKNPDSGHCYECADENDVGTITIVDQTNNFFTNCLISTDGRSIISVSLSQNNRVAVVVTKAYQQYAIGCVSYPTKIDYLLSQCVLTASGMRLNTNKDEDATLYLKDPGTEPQPCSKYGR